MNRIATCDWLWRLSVLVIAIGGCASEDRTAVIDDEVAVAGPWTLPASVHTAAQTQFVAYDEPPPWDGGIAQVETGLSHCWSEATWACQGRSRRTAAGR